MKPNSRSYILQAFMEGKMVVLYPFLYKLNYTYEYKVSLQKSSDKYHEIGSTFLPLRSANLLLIPSTGLIVKRRKRKKPTDVIETGGDRIKLWLGEIEIYLYLSLNMLSRHLSGISEQEEATNDCRMALWF